MQSLGVTQFRMRGTSDDLPVSVDSHLFRVTHAHDTSFVASLRDKTVTRLKNPKGTLLKGYLGT
jgi:hypothetical protein